MSDGEKPNAPITPRECVKLIVLPTLNELVAASADRRRAGLIANPSSVYRINADPLDGTGLTDDTITLPPHAA